MSKHLSTASSPASSTDDHGVVSGSPATMSAGATAELRVGATVTADGVIVGTFDACDEAHSMADLWNSGYPPVEGYPEFVVNGCDGECGYE